MGGNGLWLCAPSSSNTSTSPFSTSRTYCAPIMSSAQVSEAQNRAAVQLAEDQRPDAERVARADQFLVGHADEGVGAFELTQALDEAVDEPVALGARHQMKDHLGVGGRLASWRLRRRAGGAARCRW